MTEENKAVKTLAEELARTFNSIKTRQTTVKADNIIGLPSALYGILSSLDYNSENGDEIAGRILNYFHNVAALEVETIAADTAQISKLYATFGDFITLVADDATIGDLDVEEIRAGLATVGLLNIGTANIDMAQVKRSSTQTAFIHESVQGTVYIDDLAVSDASIANLAAGNILINDGNGNMVKLYVNGQGQVDTQAVSYDGDDIVNSASLSGNKIVTNSITADRLNASEIFAANATVMNLIGDNIDATRISTGSLDAAIIKAGILSDVAGKNSWNMITGEMTISNTATIGGNAIATSSDISNLQNQIDGSISTWFYDVDPTTSNPPASTWTTTEDKNIHLGDLYYNTVSGYCWRWQVSNNTYSWQRITDTDVTRALADAAQALSDAATAQSTAATAQSTANGANAQEQLIYISKVSGTTSVSATTTWVTNTTGNQNTWTLKRPTYSSSYPVLFVATQRKTVAGTVTCTTPVKDDTTTVIDGGHITTGTIDASVVNVTNINANNITSGTINGANVNAKLLNIVDANNNVIASFDSTIRLGKTNNSHAEIDFNSFELFDKNNNRYLFAGDMRNAQGVATVIDNFTGDGSNTRFQLVYYPSRIIKVSVNGTTVSNWSLENNVVVFSTAPSSGSKIKIEYETQSAVYVYKFGTGDVSTAGPCSFSEGDNTTASAICSHAEGSLTIASEACSHAEGYNTTASNHGCHSEGGSTVASGSYSHAEGASTVASGSYSHAEGQRTEASGDISHAEGYYTVASSMYAHAEGNYTIASGFGSHAEGNHTEANSYYQHVFGKCNIVDGNQTYVEIVGNGTASNSRANARTLDWSGNEWLSGSLTIKSTNGIAYQGTKATLNMIRFLDNPSDNSGNGIVIGGGGATIIGGGESAATAAAELTTGGSEIMYICNDGAVEIHTNLSSNWASRKTFTFGTNGDLTVPGSIVTSAGYLKSTANSNTVTIGSQNANYTHIYNSANIPFIFNKAVLTTSGDLGSTSYPWNNLYIGKADGAGIYYQGTKAAYRMIRFIDNTADTTGNGIAIGGGGATIIGGGESIDKAVGQISSGGSEIMYICNDGNVSIFTNLQDNWASRKEFTFSSNAIFTSPGSVVSKDSFIVLNPTADLTAANNGSSSALYNAVWGQDKNAKSYFCVEGYTSSNGDVNAYLGVQNWNTSGTAQGWEGIRITQTKAGVLSYNVSEPDKFRSAIGVDNNLTVSGYVISTGYVQANNTLYVDSGDIKMKYNNTWYSVTQNHNNGNIALNAASGGLYLGYINTTGINILSGKFVIDGTGDFRNPCYCVYNVPSFPVASNFSAGWRRICKVTGRSSYANFFIEITGGWSNGAPTCTIVAVNTRNTSAEMTVVSNGLIGLVQQLRLVSAGSSAFWLDAYFPGQTAEAAAQRMTFYGNVAVSDIKNSSAVYTESVTPAATLDLTKTMSAQIIKGNGNSDQIGYIRFKSYAWTSGSQNNSGSGENTFLLIMYTGLGSNNRKLQLYDETTSTLVWRI